MLMWDEELCLGEGGLLRFQWQNKQSRGAHTATRAHMELLPEKLRVLVFFIVVVLFS